MDAQTTIGKCCYCGQKIILERGQSLSCTACGAPLREFKSLASLKKTDVPQSGFVPIARNIKRPPTHTKHSFQKPRKAKKPKPVDHKKRKSFFSRISDIAEDLVEEVTDIFD